jgi:SAM-dependent methyltransferase
MIEDVLYKLARKALPAGAYRNLAQSFFGRGKGYFRPATYRAIYEYYRGRGLEFRGRRILEVGPGSQLFTAFFFLADGAEEVLVADPKVDPDSARAQLEQFNAAFKAGLGPEALSRLSLFTDTSAVPQAYNGRIDLICSHNVLEHVPDPGAFLAENVRLLSPEGASCHRVDVSDHTYHVFGKFRLLHAWGAGRSLYHLRYSDRAFRILNDPKCWMNRVLLPAYLEAARAHGLRVRELDRSRFREVPVHPDLGRLPGAHIPEDLYVTDFFIRLSK